MKRYRFLQYKTFQESFRILLDFVNNHRPQLISQKRGNILLLVSPMSRARDLTVQLTSPVATAHVWLTSPKILDWGNKLYDMK